MAIGSRSHLLCSFDVHPHFWMSVISVSPVSCLSHVLLTLLIGFGAVSSWTMLTGVHNFEDRFWLPNAFVFEVVFSVCLGLLLFSEVRYVDVKEVSLSVAPRLLASSGSLKVCEAKKSSYFSTLMSRNCERFATKLPLRVWFCCASTRVVVHHLVRVSAKAREPSDSRQSVWQCESRER